MNFKIILQKKTFYLPAGPGNFNFGTLNKHIFLTGLNRGKERKNTDNLLISFVFFIVHS